MPGGAAVSQADRLLTAMVRVSARKGYAATTVAHVVAEARVSRPTFYVHFQDKDDCFLSAVGAVQRELAGAVESAVTAAPAELCLRVACSELAAFAAREPERARLLMNETLAGGPRALAARDRGIAEIAAVVEAAHSRAEPSGISPDIAAALALGATQRMLAARLRRREHTGEVTSELEAWLAAYAVGGGAHRWRSFTPVAAPAPWQLLPESRVREPAPLSRAGARTRSEVSENERERILYATAQMAREKGYTSTTIADLLRCAGVTRRAFNAHFADTQQAFMAVHELAFQRAMAITAAAFAGGETWPDRVWEGGRAFIAFVVENPLLSHVAFVESNAVGPEAVRHVEDSLAAFTIFLREGQEWLAPGVPRPSPLALEAIVTTVFEALYRECRGAQAERLPGLLAHLMFVGLVPFLGTEPVNRFIESRLHG